MTSRSQTKKVLVNEFFDPITLGALGLGAAMVHGVLKGKDRKSTRLNSSHVSESRMPSSA